METQLPQNPHSYQNSKSPHFWWIFSLLTVCIIGLVSFILTKRVACAHTIAEYISYASVILSITLSVFAILYTYTSNVQIQQQFEKINKAAQDISDASHNLMTTNTRLDDSLDKIMNKLNTIDKSQKEMNAKLSDKNTGVLDVEKMKGNISDTQSQTL